MSQHSCDDAVVGVIAGPLNGHRRIILFLLGAGKDRDDDVEGIHF